MNLCRVRTRTSCLLVAVVILWTLCLRGRVLGERIIREPVNTAARISSSSVLHCTVDRGSDSIYWLFYPNGTGTGVRLYTYDGNVESKPDPNYDVNSSLINQGVFDLIVRETSVATAGIYQCSLFMAVIDAQARFVSVAPVTCDPPPGEKEILEGATVILTCDVAYTGYKPPTLSWWLTESWTPLQGEWFWNYERSTFYANVTAVPDLDMVEFTCELSFDNDPGDPGSAPVYNDTCTTHFLVLHGATRITIVPDPDGVVSVEVGDTINCSASGRPPPTFSWEGADGEIFLGNVLLVLTEWTDQQKTFTCYARNELNGQPHEASLEIAIHVTNPEPQPQEPSQAGMEAWVIAVAVVIPVVILAAAGGGAYAYVRRQKKKNDQRDTSVIYNGDIKRGAGPRPPPGSNVYGSRPFSGNQRHDNQNMAVVGGIPVKAPPGSDTDQNRRRERDSPGYGDLGVRHFPSTNSGLNASSIDVNMDPGFVSRRQPSKASLELSPKFGGSQGSIGGGGRPGYPQHPASSLPLADNPYAVIGDGPTSFQLQQQQQQQQQRGDIGQSGQSIQGVNGAYFSLPYPQTIQSVPDTSV